MCSYESPSGLGHTHCSVHTQAKVCASMAQNCARSHIVLGSRGCARHTVSVDFNTVVAPLPQPFPPAASSSPPLPLRFWLFFETGSHCVGQADLELTTPLPQSNEFWDYTPHHGNFVVVVNFLNYIYLLCVCLCVCTCMCYCTLPTACVWRSAERQLWKADPFFPPCGSKELNQGCQVW